MEALLLALGLGMMGPAVQHPDAEPHQPDAEAGQRLAARIAPGRTVVHQHGRRQAIAAEGFFQMAAHRLALLVAAGRQHQIVARMVVERGQRMAAPARHGEVTLELHLPKLVRALPLEPPPWPRMLGRRRFRQAVATPQDRGDRARRRDLGRLSTMSPVYTVRLGGGICSKDLVRSGMRRPVPSASPSRPRRLAAKIARKPQFVMDAEPSAAHGNRGKSPGTHSHKR